MGLTAATRSHGKTKSHGKNRITRDKSGTKRDLQEPNGCPGYGVMVHMLHGQMLSWQLVSVKMVQGRYFNSFDSNRWDIPDMDKCCLDKCHRDQLDSVLYVPRNLCLKFHQNLVITKPRYCWHWVCVGWWVGGMYKVIFESNPTKVLLGYVGVLTIGRLLSKEVGDWFLS